MGLAVLILGLAVFIAAHLFVTRRAARAAAIARVGLPAYRGLFALVSLIGLALIVWASPNTARMAGSKSGRRRTSCGTSPSA